MSSMTLGRIISGMGERYCRTVEVFQLWFSNHVISNPVAYLLRHVWYRRVMRFKLEPKASVLSEVRFSRAGNLSIGEYSIINNGVCIDNRQPVIVGKHVSISFETLILTQGHMIDDPLFTAKGGEVRIGDYAWLCARCIINPGVNIGEGAVVLPGSVVASDVAPYSVVGGIPAKHIRSRSRVLHHSIEWNPVVPPLG